MRRLLVIVSAAVAAVATPIAGCGGDLPAPDLAAPLLDAGAGALDDLSAGADLAPTCLPVEPALAGEPRDAGGDPSCPVARPATPDSLDELLGLVGLDRCSLGYNAQLWSGWGTGARRRDKYRLPWFDAVHDYAANAPPFARGIAAHLDDAAASTTPVTRALLVAGDRLGAPVSSCFPPLALFGPIDASRPLASAVELLVRGAGGVANAAALDADAADVPLDLQRALAEVVLGLARANADWSSLNAALTDDDRATLSQTGDLAAGFAVFDPADPATRASLLTWDLGALVSGAARLAFSVEAAGLARFAGTRGFAFDQRTPLGRIVIHDAADHTYEAAPAVDAMLLLVDTGGDDTYRSAVGAVGGDENQGHLALAIDLGGADHYGYDEVPGRFDATNLPKGATRLPSDADGRTGPSAYNGPISVSNQLRQGAARLGYGMLFDLGAGADHYRSLRFSQGAGIAGVGVLFDAGGDDVYEGEALVQGAATFGVGLLLDEAGDDVYRTYSESQGFGYVRGAGVLYDRDGADQYLANLGDPRTGGDPLYYSPQLPCDAKDGNGKLLPIEQRFNCGNSSFAQGAGFGRRPPGDSGGGGDLGYMSGGLGVLRDRAGDDVYLASVFAQATSYWFGTGVLVDGAGNDQYDGLWYVQGAGAHAGLSAFIDERGDDKYNQKVQPAATAIGVGHDYSVVWHIDAGGNDVYRAPGLCLGSGYANGTGILLNLGGDDVYQAGGDLSLGSASVGDALGFRRGIPTTGLFLDVEGKDTYSGTSKVRPADDTVWLNDRDPPDAGYPNRAVGADHAAGSVTLP